MTPVQEYVAGLDVDTIHSIIASYEQFEKDGFIGDEPIRQHTKMVMLKVTGQDDDSRITMWMMQLALECYRYFYKVTYHEPEPGFNSITLGGFFANARNF